MGKSGGQGVSRDARRRAKVQGKKRAAARRSEAENREAVSYEYLGWAWNLWRSGETEDAMGAWRRAIEVCPSNVQAWLEVEKHLQERRHAAAAIELLEVAERKGAGGPVLWYLLGHRYLEADRPHEAAILLHRIACLGDAGFEALEVHFRFRDGAARAVENLLATASRRDRERPVPRPAPPPPPRDEVGRSDDAPPDPPPPEESKVEVPEVRIRTRVSVDGFGEALGKPQADLEPVLLQIEAARLAVVGGFDSLLCLEDLHAIRRFEYQIETALRVLRVHRGRALLADEVGLGKTIEACLVLKEYVVRGLVDRVLVLVPPNLVGQWREELATKFALDFASTSDPRARRDPERFWREERRVVASIATARSRRHAELVGRIEWDLVVVDEAHHLKSRTSRGWKLVSELPRRFVLLLTATPVQNDLLELHNLITLLSPGTLETAAEFRRRYVHARDATKPKNPEELRALLARVMIRNTRGLAGVDLPPRFASTHVVPACEAEAALYARADRAAGRAYGEGVLPRPTAAHLLAAAGSSPAALARAASNLERGAAAGTGLAPDLAEIARSARDVASTAKLDRLLEIVAGGADKVIVFTRFRATLGYLAERLLERGVPCAVFHGSLPADRKDQAIAAFRDQVPVLLSTEAGGEGRNLQFCRAMVNFDLPYNPMRIEQRIGRIHRIGQEREVHVFNLALSGSIEEEILRILDEKLALFELVVGETGMVLGHLPRRRDFEELALETWFAASGAAARRAAFDRFGEALEAARRTYESMKALDRDLFRKDYEI